MPCRESKSGFSHEPRTFAKSAMDSSTNFKDLAESVREVVRDAPQAQTVAVAPKSTCVLDIDTVDFLLLRNRNFCLRNLALEMSEFLVVF